MDFTNTSPKPSALIVDLDGTLALHNGNRSPYAAELCHLDSLNETVAFFVRTWSLVYGQVVLLVSGRQEVHREPTEKWLADNDIPYDELFMRATKDFRPDNEIKREIYETQIKDSYDVFLTLDDRQKVVDTWRDLGLQCWQVNDSPD